MTGVVGPFTYEVSQILTIKNPNKTPVAFKVRAINPSALRYLSSRDKGQNHRAETVTTTSTLRSSRVHSDLDPADTASALMPAASSPAKILM